MDINDVASQSEVDRLVSSVSDLATKIEFILNKMGYAKKWIAKKRYTYPEVEEVFDTKEELNKFMDGVIKKKQSFWDYEISEDFILE